MPAKIKKRLIRSVNKVEIDNEVKEKLCIIHRGPGYFQLIVDRQQIQFVGLDAVQYFQKHYSEMGYTILHTGNGHSAYHPWLDLESIGREVDECDVDSRFGSPKS